MPPTLAAHTAPRRRPRATLRAVERRLRAVEAVLATIALVVAGRIPQAGRA